MTWEVEPALCQSKGETEQNQIEKAVEKHVLSLQSDWVLDENGGL